MPAAHYSCGGVVADLDGRTSVAGLFAVGEVACTGVQGANRLASNSITEGLVAARRCAALLADRAARRSPSRCRLRGGPAIDPAARTAITAATTRDAGVLRDGAGLARLTGELAAVPRLSGPLDLAAVEATALHTAATLLRRRGRAPHGEPRLPPPHRRPRRRRPEWEVRLVHRLDDAGRLHTRTEPVRSLVVA